MLQSSSPTSFQSILSYVERNYIGCLKNNSNDRKAARFPIELWNVNQRVKDKKSRTTNKVEAWHGTVTPDARQNLTVNKTVELFRLEQNNMEANLVKLLKGETLARKPTKAAQQKEKSIDNLVFNYDDDIDTFLSSMALVLGDN